MEENKVKKFDTIIIGAGPAGALCAVSLAQNGKKVLLLDKGGAFDDNLCAHFVRQTYDCSLHEPCCRRHSCLSGLGGAALHFEANFDNYPYADGEQKERIADFKFSPFLEAALGDATEAYIMKFYDYMFAAGLQKPAAEPAVCGNARVGASPSGTIPARLDDIKKIAAKLERDLAQYGVCLLGSRTVTDIDKNGDFIVSCKQKTGEETEKFYAKTVAVATGYRSIPMVAEFIRKFALQHSFPAETELGFRVETSAEIADKLLGGACNPRIKSACGKHRTFCICGGGRMMKYPFAWGSEDFVLDGQHAYSCRGNKTNFSLLSKVKVPAGKNSCKFAAEFVHEANTLEKGAVPAQKLADYLSGSKSAQADIDDLSLTLSGCVAANLRPLAEKYGIAIEWFIELMKSVVTDSNYFYNNTVLLAPSAVKYAPRLELKKAESNCPGLYFIGDAGGVVSGISAAGATGLMAADSIIEKYL